MYAVPAGGRVHLLTLLPVVGGYSFGPHACLPAGARHPLPSICEGPPYPEELVVFHLYRRH